MENDFDNLKKELSKLIHQEKAQIQQRFFKTGKGQYAEGDKFLGVPVPNLRKLSKKYWRLLDLHQIKRLLLSPYNEERLLGLLILVEQIEKIRPSKQVYDFYLKHLDRVNNWNLVDLSARPIVGAYLADKDRSVLDKWATSENLWIRRIAIVATWHFIKCGEFHDTFRISELLMEDKEDLIHKAVGWMLRELGKKDEAVLKNFLKKHQKIMPRTMLRYSIERLTHEDKIRFMKGLY